MRRSRGEGVGLISVESEADYGAKRSKTRVQQREGKHSGFKVRDFCRRDIVLVDCQGGQEHGAESQGKAY